MLFPFVACFIDKITDYQYQDCLENGTRFYLDIMLSLLYDQKQWLVTNRILDHRHKNTQNEKKNLLSSRLDHIATMAYIHRFITWIILSRTLKHSVIWAFWMHLHRHFNVLINHSYSLTSKRLETRTDKTDNKMTPTQRKFRHRKTQNGLF